MYVCTVSMTFFSFFNTGKLGLLKESMMWLKKNVWYKSPGENQSLILFFLYDSCVEIKTSGVHWMNAEYLYDIHTVSDEWQVVSSCKIDLAFKMNWNCFYLTSSVRVGQFWPGGQGVYTDCEDNRRVKYWFLIHVCSSDEQKGDSGDVMTYVDVFNEARSSRTQQYM